MHPLRLLGVLLWTAAGLDIAACASQSPGAAQSVSVDPPPAASPPTNAPPASSPPRAPDSPPILASASAAAQPPLVAGFVPIAETHKGKFPGVRPAKGRMFKLKAAAEAGGDACLSVVGDDGNLCSRIVQPGVELNAVNIERVTDLLSDARAFSAAAPKCFEPAHAFVFYNDKDLPIGWAEVSLSCGSLSARPTLTGIAKSEARYNVSAPALSYLRGLCKTLKFDACAP